MIKFQKAYLNQHYKDFINNYDIEFSQLMHNNFSKNDLTYILSSGLEIEILLEAFEFFNYLNKRTNYLIIQNKKDGIELQSLELINTLTGNTTKLLFIAKKLNQLGYIIDIKEYQKNPYPRIFTNDFGFKLFELFKGKVNNNLADFSFVYRKMIDDKLIHEGVRESEYRRWLNDNHEIAIDKLKQLGNCTTDLKEQLYSTLKDNIKDKN